MRVCSTLACAGSVPMWATCFCTSSSTQPPFGSCFQRLSDQKLLSGNWLSNAGSLTGPRWHSAQIAAYSARPLATRSGLIFHASSLGNKCDGHFGDISPLKSFGFRPKGSGPRNIASMRTRISSATDELKSFSGGWSGDRLTSAATPSASPALRISGCSIDASYCAHQNHGTVQTGG